MAENGSLQLELVLFLFLPWNIMQLKQPERRRQQELQNKKKGSMSKTTALQVHHASWYISLTLNERMQGETT